MLDRAGSCRRQGWDLQLKHMVTGGFWAQQAGEILKEYEDTFALRVLSVNGWLHMDKGNRLLRLGVGRRDRAYQSGRLRRELGRNSGQQEPQEATARCKPHGGPVWSS